MAAVTAVTAIPVCSFSGVRVCLGASVLALARERCWTSVTAEFDAAIQVASSDADGAASASAAASPEERVASAGRECCSCCIKMLYREKECGAAGCFVTPTHI